MFTTPYSNPVGGNPDAVRDNLREAMRLLKEAGFEVRDRQLVDAAGKPVTVEILVQDPSSERIALFYKPSLERIGVTVSIRVVDDAQYQNRIRAFDFDMITDLWGQSLSPGNEQRDYWGSAGRRAAGFAQHHRHQEPGGRCADRQGDLRQGSRRRWSPPPARSTACCCGISIVVPQFTYGFSRYARWDRFSHAEPLPKYGRSGLPSLWWYDADKAAKIGKRS